MANNVVTDALIEYVFRHYAKDADAIAAETMSQLMTDQLCSRYDLKDSEGFDDIVQHSLKQLYETLQVEIRVDGSFSLDEFADAFADFASRTLMEQFFVVPPNLLFEDTLESNGKNSFNADAVIDQLKSSGVSIGLSEVLSQLTTLMATQNEKDITEEILREAWEADTHSSVFDDDDSERSTQSSVAASPEFIQMPPATPKTSVRGVSSRSTLGLPPRRGSRMSILSMPLSESHIGDMFDAAQRTSTSPWPERVSRNHGRIGSAKWNTLALLFEEADSDGDGKIDADELCAVLEDPELSFLQLDQLKNLGPTYFKSLFAQLDTDDNGFLDKAEFTRAFEEILNEDGSFGADMGVVGAQLLALRAEHAALRDKLTEVEQDREAQNSQAKHAFDIQKQNLNLAQDMASDRVESLEKELKNVMRDRDEHKRAVDKLAQRLESVETVKSPERLSSVDYDKLMQERTEALEQSRILRGKRDQLEYERDLAKSELDELRSTRKQSVFSTGDGYDAEADARYKKKVDELARILKAKNTELSDKVDAIKEAAESVQDLQAKLDAEKQAKMKAEEAARIIKIKAKKDTDKLKAHLQRERISSLKVKRSCDDAEHSLKQKENELIQLKQKLEEMEVGVAKTLKRQLQQSQSDLVATRRQSKAQIERLELELDNDRQELLSSRKESAELDNQLYELEKERVAATQRNSHFELIVETQSKQISTLEEKIARVTPINTLDALNASFEIAGDVPEDKGMNNAIKSAAAIGNELAFAMHLLSTNSNDEYLRLSFQVPTLPPHWDRKTYPKPDSFSTQDTQDLIEQHERERTEVISSIRDAVSAVKKHQRGAAKNNRRDSMDTKFRLLQIALLDAVRVYRKHSREYNEILLSGRFHSAEKQRSAILTRLDFLPISDQDREDMADLLSKRNFDAAAKKLKAFEELHVGFWSGDISSAVKNAWSVVVTDEAVRWLAAELRMQRKKMMRRPSASNRLKLRNSDLHNTLDKALLEIIEL
eukprot:m.74265 g.74265  ORF g.74265 m.74265 type:complete len:999 (+) comp24643_c0_seq1:175-3171(+)